MLQIWKDWTEWFLSKTKHLTNHNQFVPIPQEHKDDEHIKQTQNHVSNNNDPQPSNQCQTFLQKFMANASSKTVPRQVFRDACLLGVESEAEPPKANLLNTKQLLGLTYFAFTAVRFICKLNYIFKIKLYF